MAVVRDHDNHKRFAAVSLHLDHASPASRKESVLALAEWARAQDIPIVMMGDFNEPAESPVLDPLRGTGALQEGSLYPLTDSYATSGRKEEGTLNAYSASSERRIDLVLVSPQWRVEDCRVVRYRRNGIYVSDHYPVVAELRWPKEPYKLALRSR